MKDSSPEKHRNDIYGDDLTQQNAVAAAIPAATVVLLRDNPDPEVLMLHKTSKIAFGGMWVFPGGRIDEADYPEGGDPDTAARNAAVRETFEEAGIHCRPDDFIWFARWTPPPITPKRFTTWFFAAAARSHDVVIDGGEIQDHGWLRPADALQRHAAGEIDLAPPTWVTLHRLTRFRRSSDALASLGRGSPTHYQTRIGVDAQGVRVAMWHGDAGYEAGDATAGGPRHRLIMRPGGFVFENTVEAG